MHPIWDVPDRHRFHYYFPTVDLSHDSVDGFFDRKPHRRHCCEKPAHAVAAQLSAPTPYRNSVNTAIRRRPANDTGLISDAGRQARPYLPHLQRTREQTLVGGIPCRQGHRRLQCRAA